MTFNSFAAGDGCARPVHAENEFLNEAIVGEALALQVKALVGERTAWVNYFKSVNDADGA